MSLNTYGLDPAWYVSGPSLSLDCLLRKTQVELELISDPTIYQFCERAVRGGFSSIFLRKAEANNPMVPGYNPAAPTSYLWYTGKIHISIDSS